MQELFRLQDLKDDGVLEEEELIKLNEKISMLHYGKDVDKSAVRAKFRELFRSRLDSAGHPVAYPRFREYMLQVLREVDTDPRAQEMILEQFIAEAQSARAVFYHQSFASASDFPFMPTDPAAHGPRAAQTLETMPENAVVTPSVYDLGGVAPVPAKHGPGYADASNTCASPPQALNLHRTEAVGEARAVAHPGELGARASRVTVEDASREQVGPSRRLELMGKLEQEFEPCMLPKQNSKPLPREPYVFDGTLANKPSSVASARPLCAPADKVMGLAGYAHASGAAGLPRPAGGGRLLGVVGGEGALEPRYIS